LFPEHLRTDPETGKVKDANRVPINKIGHARRAAGEHPSPGKIVLELMSGFWTYTTSDIHEKTL
jgi:hypothetical protein